MFEFFQGICSQFGLFLGFRLNDEGVLELQLIDIPVSKTGGSDYDFEVRGDNLIKSHNLGGSSKDIINAITVYYYDINDNYERKSVQVTDSNSVSKYGKRGALVEETNTSSIDTYTKASKFANLILNDTAEVIENNQIELIISPKLKIFDVLNVVNKVFSDDEKKVSIESIEHNFEKGSYTTRVKGVSALNSDLVKLRSGKNKYKNMLIRPGYKQQITAPSITNLFQYPNPRSFSLKSTGLEAIDLTPTAYAVLRWEKPLGYNPNNYRLEVALSTDTSFENAKKYDVKDAVNIQFFDTRVELVPNIAYIARVAGVSKEGIIGEYTDTLDINAIGDNVAPATPSNIVLNPAIKQISVTYNANTEKDFLKYKIYMKKEGTPTGTDLIKETAGTNTVISNLEADVDYHFKVSAVDTSGNESVLSSEFITQALFVGDDTLNEIYERTLHIRTQEQFIAWLKTLPSDDSEPNLAYDTVFIHQKSDKTTYTVSENVGGTLKKFKAKNFAIKSDKGVTVQYNKTYLSQINIASNEFSYKNLNWLTLTADTGNADFVFTIRRYNTTSSVYAYNFYNANLEKFALGIEGVSISKTVLENLDLFEYRIDVSDDVYVKNSTVRLDQGQCCAVRGATRIYLEKNTFKGEVVVQSSDLLNGGNVDLDGGYIINNKWELNSDTRKPLKLLNGATNNYKDLTINDNEILIDDTAGLPSVYFVTSTTADGITARNLEQSNIEGNIAKSNYTTANPTLVGWLNSTGTGTYIDPNTNKNKTGL